jgi:membrane protein DedA with SNARE-associated domain
MDQLIIEAIERGGYWGIFLLMVLENVIPPVPSEVIMGVGGLLVERGSMSFWPMLLIGTVGATLGNYFWYWVGDKWGYRRLEPFIARWGRWLTLDWEHIEQAVHVFQKHGQWVVFFLRFSPFLRTIISLPAGLAHMPKGRFLAYTFFGTILWNAALIAGGRLVGRWLEESQSIIGLLLLGFLWLGALFYVYRVITWKPRDRRSN